MVLENGKRISPREFGLLVWVMVEDEGRDCCWEPAECTARVPQKKRAK